ncbi:hypothetical protein [Pseudomonas citronellolis]|uniref:hypothetical protein n=1 Tax=Pseudomonas citronellolis TaxID=53408 RepID=UPI00085297D4|nr:hypothetical protein [Pseudomonas humi]
MSIYSLEKVLWDLHADPQKVEKFHNDPMSFLADYSLAEDERELVLSQNVRVMADRGVSQMLLFISWQAVNGGAPSIPEYMRRMNTPADQN